jgi:hypothetical protein
MTSCAPMVLLLIGANNRTYGDFAQPILAGRHYKTMHPLWQW